MKNILINSIILSIVVLIISCDPDEPTSPKLDCESVYPIYESVITDYQPSFEWCEIENVEEYRFQLSTVEDFSELLFDTDTIVNENRVSLSYVILHHAGYSTWKLPWGTKYYWRVAAIKDTVQQDWSDTYIFETNDIRDDVVGIYEAKKRKIEQNHNGNPIYYDSVYSIHEIEVEKLEGSRGIRVKDNTYGDFDIEMEDDLDLYWWIKYFDAWGKFKIEVDSFEIQDIYCPVPPCSGFRYSGRE